MFIPQAQPHAQSLFLFPIVFGINLIHFFDFFDDKEERYRAAGNSIVCFAASIACQSRHVTVRRMRTVSKSATFLATESVNSAPIKRGKTEVQIFWQGKAQNSSPILRCTFLARRSAKLIANFSATMVTSLPSFSLFLSLSLSLSLSLYLSLSHRMYVTHNIGSASALPIIFGYTALLYVWVCTYICARVWCMYMCGYTSRVLRRAGIAGILPAGVWLCRLQRKFGRFLPAGIFRWFYVFAGWRSFCLSKTDPKRRNALVSILVVAEPSGGRSSSCLKVRLSTRARRVTVRVFRTRPCADGETITKAASMRVRSRASDAECPEALPVDSVALHALAI